ncbi:MAG: hypothetical protein ABJM43_22020 [Paracoccaceae bacterium]
MSYKPVFKVVNQSELTLDGSTWRVQSKSKDGYLVNGADGDHTTLTFQRVDRAIKEGKCKVLSPVDAEKQKRLLDFTGGFTHIDQVPEQQQRNARARAALVMAMETLESEGENLVEGVLNPIGIRKRLYAEAIAITGNKRLFEDLTIGPTRPSSTEPGTIVPKGRTLLNLMKKYHRFDRNPVVLINRDNKKGCQDPIKACKLSNWQRQFVMYVIGRLNSPKKPKLAVAYGAAQSVFPIPEIDIVRGITYPSITTVRNWYNGISFLARELARLGTKATRLKYGAGASEIRAMEFGERCAMDQYYVSIFVNSDGLLEAKALDRSEADDDYDETKEFRVWLHLMVDVATRMPLAWILSETAHSDQTMALLRMATRDKTREKARYGCKRDPAPAAGLLLTVADNGSATRNGRVYSAQVGSNMTVQTGRTYHSNDNPIAESFFSTLQFGVLNTEDGYAGSHHDDLPGYESAVNAKLSVDQLQGVLTRYFVDEYPLQSHRGTGMFGATPAEKLEQTVKDYGAITPPNPETRRLHLGQKKTMSTTSEGVLFSNIPYNSHELQAYHDGNSKKVNIYLDPDFLHTVTIQPVGTNQTFEASLTMTALQNLTYESALGVMARAAQGNPTKRKLSNQMLMNARADRVKRSGFYKDPQLPENYRTLEQLEKQAERLTHMTPEHRSTGLVTVQPGQLTGGRKKRVQQPLQTQVADAGVQPAPKPKTSGGRFQPIKESKL